MSDGNPISSEQAADPIQPVKNDFIRVFDKQGQQVMISRQQWRENVLPANLKEAWNNPDELFTQIVFAINDGFRSDVVAAARHLYDIDPDPVRGAGLWGIMLIEEGRLDEAEAVFRDFITKRGENAAILADLGKVYIKRNDPSKAKELLWHALQLDPNQENGLKLYESLFQGPDGNDAVQAALQRVAALPKSWRAQLALAKQALASRQLKTAIAYYQESLSRAVTPVPNALLMQMSGDLGLNHYPVELISLTEPLYDIRTHGIEIGNNLLKAHLELGHVDPVRRLLAQLHAQNRLDWKETLSYWDAHTARAGIITKSAIARASVQITPRRSKRFRPYLSLLAVAAEVVWIGIMLLGVLFIVGDEPHTTTRIEEQLFDLIAALPAAVGLIFGIVGIARGWIAGTVQWICVIFGLAGCLFFVGGFGWGFFH